MAMGIYDEWAQQDSIPLFEQSSKMLLRVTLIVYFGQSFVDKHQTELMALVESFQQDLLSPWVRLLPKWASPSGRRLIAAQAQLSRLMFPEVQARLKNIDLCEEADDYLSFLLVSNLESGVQQSEREYVVQFVSHFSERRRRRRSLMTCDFVLFA